MIGMETAKQGYDTDLTDTAWELIASLLPEARPGGRPNHRFALCRERHPLFAADRMPVAPSAARVPRMGDSLFLLSQLGGGRRVGATPAHPLRTGTDGLASGLPQRSDHGRSIGENHGTWRHSRLRRIQARERTQAPYSGGYARPANRVEPANMSDRRAGARLLPGLPPLFPRINTVIADAGHESRRWARELMRQSGWKLLIVKRSQRAFKITGLTWIVERTFAWLGRNRRFRRDYEYRVQTGYSGR